MATEAEKSAFQRWLDTNPLGQQVKKQGQKAVDDLMERTYEIIDEKKAELQDKEVDLDVLMPEIIPPGSDVTPGNGYPVAEVRLNYVRVALASAVAAILAAVGYLILRKK